MALSLFYDFASLWFSYKLLLLISLFVDFFTGANTSKKQFQTVNFKCLRAQIQWAADMCLWNSVERNTSPFVKFKFMQSNEVCTTFSFSFLSYQSSKLLSMFSLTCFLKLATIEMFCVCVKIRFIVTTFASRFLIKVGIPIVVATPRGTKKKKSSSLVFAIQILNIPFPDSCF